MLVCKRITRPGIILVTLIALRHRRRRMSASPRGFIVVPRVDTRQFMRNRGETEYADECSAFPASRHAARFIKYQISLSWTIDDGHRGEIMRTWSFAMRDSN